MNALRRFILLPCLAVLLLAGLGWSHQVLAVPPDRPFPPNVPTDALPTTPLPAQAATACEDGFAGSYPCNNIDLLAFMPLADIGGGSGNDIWGWSDPQTGREYALMGRSSGTSFVDITDPENPVYLGNLPTETANSTWRDIKVYADHAFVVSEASGHGMQIFDLTRLRDVTSPPVTFDNDAHYSGFGNAHNIVINEETGFAYGVGTSTCAGGLHMVDIQNPLSPVNAGCFSSDGYTHDAQCIVYDGPDTEHAGQEICFNANEDTLTIVDVTDKSAPVQLSRTGYPGSGYAHQGWITEDHTYFLLDDELDELNFGHNTRTRVFNVTDLDAPTLDTIYDGPVGSSDHNLYIVGDNAFMSNYQSGLRIVDISDIAAGSLVEVGYFDVYPANDSAGFSGTWSNYPYFDSGVIVVSGTDSGLFILDPGLDPDFRLEYANMAPQVCEGDTVSVNVDVAARFGYTGTVTLGTFGLPGGVTDSYSVNPVVVPGSSVMTLSADGATAGEYGFFAGGSDGVLTRSAELSLSVYDGTPGATTLVAPADGAVDVMTQPVLSWNGSADAAAYDVALGTTPDVISSLVDFALNVDATSWRPTTVLEPLTTYYWAVRTRNACGTGGVTAVYSFTTRDIPPVLLVDDDDNTPDVRSTYTAALDANGIAYDVWDTANSDNEPDAGTLAQYDLILWFSGTEVGGAAGPGSDGEAALSTFLDAGGCFLISSEAYYQDHGLTPFMQNYLGLSFAVNDVGHTSVTGQIPPFLGTFPINAPFSDRVSRNGSGAVLFSGTAGDAALYSVGDGYITSYWGFALEALPEAQQVSFIDAIYDGCQFYTTTGLDPFAAP